MPFSFHFESETGIAIITCSGELRVSEAREGVSELWENPDWDGKSAVWDFRTSQFLLTSPEIQNLADYVLSHQRATPPEKVAFVTERDVDFGLARVFEAFRHDARTAFRVFRDLDEALHWVRSE